MSFNKVNKTTGGLTQIEDILIDSTPTQGSTNAVQSGGTFNAIKAVSDNVDDISDEIADMNNVLGAKNFVALNKSPYRTQVLTKVSVTNQTEDSVTLTSIAANYACLHLYYTLPAGQYIVCYDFESDDTSYQPSITMYVAGGPSIAPGGSGIQKNEQRIVTVKETFEYLDIRLFITTANAAVRTGTFKNFMIRPASIVDGTYVPYAKTNKELTEDIKEINSQLGSIDYDGAGAHNSIYRGKYLGAEVTAEQYTAISSGKFTDLYIGDYWTIGGVNYRIGAFDYWYNTGDTACTTHHVLLVPDTNLASGKMNSTDTTAGGYAGSDLKTGANDNTALATAKDRIISAFGSSHILSHREYFTNAVANGKPSGVAGYDSDIDLMNENMVYGTNIFLPHSDGSTVPDLRTIDKTQIKLFADRPDLIAIRAHYWLRDIMADTYFARVANVGTANYGHATDSYGVRPAFAIKG